MGIRFCRDFRAGSHPRDARREAVGQIQDLTLALDLLCGKNRAAVTQEFEDAIYLLCAREVTRRSIFCDESRYAGKKL
jgi:hypothetical protein